jgi:hypothetical protein
LNAGQYPGSEVDAVQQMVQLVPFLCIVGVYLETYSLTVKIIEDNGRFPAPILAAARTPDRCLSALDSLSEPRASYFVLMLRASTSGDYVKWEVQTTLAGMIAAWTALLTLGSSYTGTHLMRVCLGERDSRAVLRALLPVLWLLALSAAS